MPDLLTVGHGPLHRGPLGELLTDAGVEVVVDVRRFPGSRTNPDVAREALQDWLPRAGVAYRWEQDLGGRRSLPAGVPEVDTWWTVAAFRAYAAHTRSPAFRGALDDVLAVAERQRVAVMCSESVWWRCHRRIIADVAVLARGARVRHLMPSGRLADHQPSPGARVTGDGLLVWDAGQS